MRKLEWIEDMKNNGYDEKEIEEALELEEMIRQGLSKQARQCTDDDDLYRGRLDYIKRRRE